MKLHHRRLLTFSGWISLIANLLAITGFLLNHWPWGTWQPSQGFWIVFSFVTTVYSLVIWSIWTWRRSMGNDALQHTANKMRGGVFLLNAMAALPTLTLWLYLVLAALDDLLGTSALRWILALAIAWSATPFIAMGLSWTGSTLGPLLEPAVGRGRFSPEE